MVCIDFGLSRHDELPDLLDEEFTIPMGTFPYIAPEQYLRRRDDLRSDLFALGAMIYEGATGKMPFGKPETLKGVRKRLWRDPVPPRAIDPMIPEWLQEIILRALEVDPAKRYQSAAQMLFDLQHPQQVRLTERGRKIAPDGRMDGLPPLAEDAQDQGLRPPAADERADRQGPRDDGRRRPLARDGAAEPAPPAVGAAHAGDHKPDARVACVNVIKTARIGIDQTTTETGEHIHVARLVALQGLGVPSWTCPKTG
jgi:hypothetical protein